jgi:hypothetical protein
MPLKVYENEIIKKRKEFLIFLPQKNQLNNQRTVEIQ